MRENPQRNIKKKDFLINMSPAHELTEAAQLQQYSYVCHCLLLVTRHGQDRLVVTVDIPMLSC